MTTIERKKHHMNITKEMMVRRIRRIRRRRLHQNIWRRRRR